MCRDEYREVSQGGENKDVDPHWQDAGEKEYESLDTRYKDSNQGSTSLL